MANVEETRPSEITEAGAGVSEKGTGHEHGIYDIEGVVADQTVEA